MNFHQLLDGHELGAFQKALHGYGKRAIRLRADRLDTTLPFEVSEVPWFPSGRFLVDSDFRPAAALNYAVADYYIQDAASMLPLALLDVQPGDWICDLCAAPGGKASAIAERLGPNGFLLANESIRSRLDVLRYALARTGKPTYAICSYDPERLADNASQCWDAILVDAPCSGQTLVGKNKRDANAFAENQIEHCALRQKRILHSAVQMLKLGGRLIYSTCTFAVEENEAQIRWLLNEYPNSLEPIQRKQLEQWSSPQEPGCYRLWPHRDDCAGGFAAGLRLTRPIDSERWIVPPSAENRRRQPHPRSGDKSFPRNHNNKAEKARQSAGNELLLELGNLLNLDVEWTGRDAHCISAGVRSARSKITEIVLTPPTVLIESGSHFVPTQALAMLTPESFIPLQANGLNDSQSLEFMKGNAVVRESSFAGMSNGWSIAQWNAKPMGWFKSAGNRWNNHLPSWARLNIGEQVFVDESL